MTTTTPDMGLVLADVSVTPGPLWAQILNTALSVVDSHDHTTGNGVQITTAALNIDANLDLNEFSLLRALSVGLKNQGAAVTGTINSIQDVAGNFYWINSAGQAVQITSGNSVVSTGSGVLVFSTPSSYPYSVTTADAQRVLGVDTSAAHTLTLPAATNLIFLMIKDVTGTAKTHNITITPNGTDTIEGANTSWLMTKNYESIGLISDGISSWYVV